MLGELLRMFVLSGVLFLSAAGHLVTFCSYLKFVQHRNLHSGVTTYGRLYRVNATWHTLRTRALIDLSGPSPGPRSSATTPPHGLISSVPPPAQTVKSAVAPVLSAHRNVPHTPPILADYNPPFPRLLGMNIGAKDYGNAVYLEHLSRLDIVILGFYKDWRVTAGRPSTIDSVVVTLRDMNPHVLLGQYTILSESYDDPQKHVPEADIIAKLNREDWWVRDRAGRKVQWTTRYHAWQTNFTSWSQPDSHGRRFPQWLALRNYRAFFDFHHGFDIWYSDNVSAAAPVSGDWENNGREQSKISPAVATAYRAGEASYWTAIRKLDPHVLIVGNANNSLDFPQYKDKLNGVFLEGLMGESWSIINWGGWNRMMSRYHAVFHNLLAPKIVAFNVWGSLTNYRFFRFAYTSCLMDNGYFSYTDRRVGYSSVPWFDEYDVKLGFPTDPPQIAAWKHGVYRRTFQRGLALVNPTDTPQTVTLPAHRWRHFRGTQDPVVNDGRQVTRITLEPKDGVVLVKDHAPSH